MAASDIIEILLHYYKGYLHSRRYSPHSRPLL